jgi:phosphoglycolate phosphatase
MLWGVVTNKPRRFTQPLMKSLGLSARAACIVSGDDSHKPKPAPDTLLLACQQSNSKPDACIYVGDAERDVIAGVAAGMATVVACYGYLAEQDTPEKWGADNMINTPLELLGLL